MGASGKVYVADTRTIVQVFTAQGEYITDGVSVMSMVRRLRHNLLMVSGDRVQLLLMLRKMSMSRILVTSVSVFTTAMVSISGDTVQVAAG